jgi:hypothetical protein
MNRNEVGSTRKQLKTEGQEEGKPSKKKYKDVGLLKETAETKQHTWFRHVNGVEDERYHKKELQESQGGRIKEQR